jgi:cell division protein FtsQ
MTTKPESSRAEAVRQRREKENTKKLQQATRRAYNPTPTVPSRNRSYSAARTRRVRNQNRFNIVLGVLPGVHRPAIHLPQLRSGPRAASLIMTFMLVAALYFAWTLPYFRTTWATVIGNTLITADEINAALGVAGQSVFTIQPEQVETRLRMHYPELTSVQVKVYLPNHVYVTVAERQPVILWQQGEGYTWIDLDGVAFRPRGPVTGLVPVIGNGTPPARTALMDDPLNPPPYISKEMVEAILVLAPNVPAGTSMLYNPLNGLGWTDSRGWQVYFGANPKDMALKVRVYQSLVDSLLARGVYPTFVSVAYPDAPYYRMAETNNDGE